MKHLINLAKIVFSQNSGGSARQKEFGIQSFGLLKFLENLIEENPHFVIHVDLQIQSLKLFVCVSIPQFRRRETLLSMWLDLLQGDSSLD